MKKIIALILGMFVIAGFMSIGGTAYAEKKTHKSYVCKYVGTPGVDEVLQSGNNPIWVDNHALAGHDVEVAVGDVFSDAQGRSVVIVANTPKLNSEPGLESCPTGSTDPIPDPCDIDPSQCTPDPTCDTDPTLCPPDPTCDTDPSLCPADPTCESDPSPETCPRPDNVELSEEGATCEGGYWFVGGFRTFLWMESFKGNNTPGWYPHDTWSRPIFKELTPAQFKALECKKADKPEKPDVDVTTNVDFDVPDTLPNTGFGWLSGVMLALGILLISIGVTLFVRGWFMKEEVLEETSDEPLDTDVEG